MTTEVGAFPDKRMLITCLREEEMGVGRGVHADYIIIIDFNCQKNTWNLQTDRVNNTCTNTHYLHIK